MSDDFEEELIKSRVLKKMMDAVKKIQTFPNEPIDLSDAEFEDFVKKYDRIVVDCWADWCQPCRMIAPIIEELAREYKGKVVFGKLNVDENRGTVMKYKIMSIPTFLIFKDGALIDRIVGALPKPLLEARIRKALGLCES